MKPRPCPTCGTLRIAKADGTPCRACWIASKADARVCGCGSPKTAASATCWDCYTKGRLGQVSRTQVCGCGASKHRTAQMCMACRQALGRQKKTCTCGAPKSARALHCRPCSFPLARLYRPDIMQHFQPARLRALMDRYGFSTRSLAEASGEPVSTLTGWLGGKQKPTRATLAKVMEALGLVQCHACLGTGAERSIEVETLMDFVEQRGDEQKFGPIRGKVKAVPRPDDAKPKKPHHWGAEKAKDYRQRVKAQRAEESAKEERAS